MRGKSACVPAKEFGGWLLYSYLGHALGMDSSVADDVLSEEVLSKRTKLKSL